MCKKRCFLSVVLFSAAIFLLGLNPLGAQEKSDDAESCVKPAKGPIVAGEQNSPSPAPGNRNPVAIPLAKVGKPAPDFEANAYQNGRFINIRLSDYKGHWVVLCFYPGDFTFV